MPDDKSKLKLIYNDILQGYSYASHGIGKLYIKHLSTFDSADFDFVYNKYFLLAREKGLPAIIDKEKELIESGEWSKEKDRKILDTENYIKGLYTTKTKLWKQNDLNSLNRQIKQAEDDLKKLQDEKQTLLGTTAETYANKKLNEYSVFSTLYNSSALNNRFFSPDDFDDLEDDILRSLVVLYNEKIENFSEYNLKAVALSPFFSNLFYLAEDNVFNFYGKPIINLTFYQVQLFMYGKYFKGMFSDSKTRPPEHIMEDPDKVIDWFNSAKNVNELIEKNKNNESGNLSLVGATKEDLERAGVKPTKNKVNLFVEAAKKKNGELSMEEIIKLEMGN